MHQSDYVTLPSSSFVDLIVSMKGLESIQQLSSETAQRLAAGVVIITASDVVKELVENALDAKASNIMVRLVDGGLDTIMVKDDGTGISAIDRTMIGKQHCTNNYVAPMAFEKRIDDESTATLLELDSSGEVIRTHLTSGQRGTCVVVRNVFAKFPVRRKLVEKQPIKRTIACILERLYCYAIHASQLHNTVTEWISPGNGCTIKEKVADYWINWQEGQLTIEALLPHMKTDSALFHSTQSPIICVNARPMQRVGDIRMIERVIHQHYSTAIDKVQMPTNMYDINIDPAKDRILFHDREMIMNSLNRMLEHIYSARPTNDQHSHPSKSGINKRNGSANDMIRNSSKQLLVSASNSDEQTKSVQLEDSNITEIIGYTSTKVITPPTSPVRFKQKGSKRSPLRNKVEPQQHLHSGTAHCVEATTTSFWECPDRESPLFTRKMTESISVDWQRVKEDAVAHSLEIHDTHSLANNMPTIIGQIGGICIGTNSNGLVAIRLAKLDTSFPEPIVLDPSMIGGNPAFQLLLSLETEPSVMVMNDVLSITRRLATRQRSIMISNN
ncbi:histidine kinase-like ATPase [Syncephalis plumigaleata]|nr:histidine kinase-like ATPase [Syncephalis plumigaleata]